MKILKFKDLSERLQKLAKTIGVLMFLVPFIWAGIKNTKPYIEFVVKGPSLVKSVAELEKSVFVITGVVAADLPYVDSCTYYVTWRNEELIGRIKSTRSGNKYVFIPDGIVGERAFSLSYNYDMRHYYFIDFEGAYIELKKR